MPSPLAKEKALMVCDLIAEGDSINKACKTLKCDPRGFMRALATGDQELDQSYARARRHRAESRAEEIDAIKDRMVLKKDDPLYIDPQAGRVLIDAIKWQAGKENQGRYGDKIMVESEGEQKQLGRADAVAALRSGAVTVEALMTRWTKPVEAIEEPKTVETAQPAAGCDFVDIDD